MQITHAGKWLLVIISLTLFSLSAFSGTSVKGVGQMQYTGIASKKDAQEVLRLAKINALERYVGDQKSRIRLFEKNRDKILSELDRYFLSAIIIDKSKDKKVKQLTTVIKAELNTELLETILEEDRGTAEGEYMTFIFVAREQRSIKSASSQSNFTDSSKKGANLGDSETNMTARLNENSSGSSKTSFADTIEYDTATSEEISSAMNKVFSEAGFEVVDAEYLEEESGGLLSIDAFKTDYGKGDDLSSATLSSAVSGAKSLEIPYMAIGTLNIGVHELDPVSGLQRVYVTVSGKVLSLEKRFPKTMASVGPVQYAGLGSNPTVAKNNALSTAAEKAAETLVAQLKAKL